MALTYRFRVSNDAVERAFGFAEEVWDKRAQSTKDFGSVTARKKNDFVADMVEGKVSEDIFLSFLMNNFLDLQSIVDYNIYENPHDIDFGNDLQDFIYKGIRREGLFKTDIKSARHYSKWLLVEKHKCWADVYILISIKGLNDDWEYNPYAVNKQGITGEVAGFAYYTDLIDQETKKPWFIFKQKDPLYQSDDVIQILRRQRIADAVHLAGILDKGVKAGDIRTMNVRLKSPVNYGMPRSILRNSQNEWRKFLNALYRTSLLKGDCIITNEGNINKIITPFRE